MSQSVGREMNFVALASFRAVVTGAYDALDSDFSLRFAKVAAVGVSRRPSAIRSMAGGS